MKPIVLKLIEPRMTLDDSRKRFGNRMLVGLIVPIIVEQFLLLLVGMADTLMISYAGEAAVSGVSLVNQLNMLFIMIFSAVAAGGSVVASQYAGCRDEKNGRLASGQLVMISALAGILITAFILILGHPVFSLLFGNVEADVFEEGMLYLRLSAYSYIALAVYNAAAGLFRAMGRTREIMYVSIIMNVINVAGNAIGVFGLHAGVRGVAYPSLISRVFAAVVMMWLLCTRGGMMTAAARNIFTWNGTMIRRILHIAVPNGLENGLFQLAKVALTSIIALFGTIQIAAYGVAQSFWGMGALFSIAMGPAFITVIGQSMGAGDEDAAEYYSRKLLRMTYLGGVVWNLAYLVLSPLFLKLYDLSAETVRLVLIMIVLHCIFNAMLAPPAFPLSSGLRAAGDVRYTMVASIVATVVCRVAFSVLFGIFMHMGVIGITLAMVVDWAVKTVLILVRLKSGKWKEYRVI